jgi:hypothetical protein
MTDYINEVRRRTASDYTEHESRIIGCHIWFKWIDDSHFVERTKRGKAAAERWMIRKHPRYFTKTALRGMGFNLDGTPKRRRKDGR